MRCPRQLYHAHTRADRARRRHHTNQGTTEENRVACKGYRATTRRKARQPIARCRDSRDARGVRQFVRTATHASDATELPGNVRACVMPSSRS